MSRHERFIDLAANAAALSSQRQALGAILVRAGNVLSVASNRGRNIPSNAPSGARHVHAEAAAVSLAGNPRGATAYVCRLAKNGDRTMAKPCNSCMKCLIKHGVVRVIYTGWQGEIIIQRLSEIDLLFIG